MFPRLFRGLQFAVLQHPNPLFEPWWTILFSCSCNGRKGKVQWKVKRNRRWSRRRRRRYWKQWRVSWTETALCTAAGPPSEFQEKSFFSFSTPSTAPTISSSVPAAILRVCLFFFPFSVCIWNSFFDCQCDDFGLLVNGLLQHEIWDFFFVCWILMGGIVFGVVRLLLFLLRMKIIGGWAKRHLLTFWKV